MHNPSPEYLEAFEKALDADIALLQSRGWIDAGQGYWLHPTTTEKYGFVQAVDKTHCAYIKELGWNPVVVAVHHQERKRPPCDEWALYVSPHTNKIYMFPEVIDFIVYGAEECGYKTCGFSRDVDAGIPRPVNHETMYHFNFSLTGEPNPGIHTYVGKTKDYDRINRLQKVAGPLK